MKTKTKAEEVSIKTHVWKSGLGKLRMCSCGQNKTTAIVKNVFTGKSRPMCERCAVIKKLA